MVKGKLIENNQYYNIRAKQLIIGAVPLLLLIAFSFLHFFQIIQISRISIIWIFLVGFILTFILLILVFKSNKRMTEYANRTIEMDTIEIRLKSSNDKLLETINLKDLDKILVKKEYSIPQTTRWEEVKDEIAGKHNKHYVKIIQDNVQRRFDFELDSNYMLNELKKLIEVWIRSKYNVEHIND